MGGGGGGTLMNFRYMSVPQGLKILILFKDETSEN